MRELDPRIQTLIRFRKGSLVAFKVTFLLTTVVFFGLLAAYVRGGYNPLMITTTTQLLGIYLAPLLTLSPYFSARRAIRVMDLKEVVERVERAECADCEVQFGGQETSQVSERLTMRDK